MAVEVEVFIDLEERAARVLGRALRTSATKQVRGIASALRRADVGAAAQMVRRFDLGPAVRSVSDQLELIALNAVVLGAAQFVDGHAARRTKFVREKVIPVEVKNVVAQIVESVSSTQTEHVRSTIEQMVNEAEMEDPRVGGLGMSETTLKHEVLVMKQFAGLAGRLNAAVNSGVSVISTLSSNVMTSRMVQFGALTQAIAGKITTWQWNAVLDSRTCPVCRGLHGKVFKVDKTLDSLRTIINSRSPTVAKQLNPWPGSSIKVVNRLAGMTNSQLQSKEQVMPPIHGRCRCVASIIGTVPKSEIKGFKVRPVRKPLPGAVPEGADVLTDFEVAESTEAMYRKPNGDWLSDRVASIHDPAVDDLFEGKVPVPADEQPVYEFLGGGSGAGKGSIQRKGLVKVSDRTVKIDADELKKALPEYNAMVSAGDTEAAAFAHEESSFLSKRALARSLGSRNDVLLDGTGDGGIDKVIAKIQPAKALGYKVKGDYVTIPTDEAVKRALARAERTGRLVPEEDIRRIHAAVSKDLKDAVDRKLFDEVRLFDNFSAADNEPILVMQQINGETTIFRDDLWRQFLAKADEDIDKKILTKKQVDGVKKAARLRAKMAREGKLVQDEVLPKVVVPKLKPFPEIDPRADLDPGVGDRLKNAVLPKDRDDLSLAEKSAVNNYTTFRGIDLNTNLRAGTESLSISFPKSIGTQKRFVKLLDSAISKSKGTADDLVVYRGAKARGRLVAKLKPDAVVADDGYLSWTVRRKVANDFAQTELPNGEEGVRVVFRVRLPRDQKALVIGGIQDAITGEAEVLLPRKLAYRIVKIEDDVDSFGGLKVKLITLQVVDGTKFKVRRLVLKRAKGPRPSFR